MSIREGVLVRLTGSTGAQGLGEAAPLLSLGGGTLMDALKVIERYAPALVAQALDQADASIAALDLSLPGVAAAACAFDTALCDLRACDATLPLAQFLGGCSDHPVPVNATIGARAADAARMAAVEAVNAGFKHVKLKVGVAESIQSEVDRIGAVRAAIGPDICLRLDANGAWSRADAVTVLRAIESYKPEYVEQPVAADDLTGMRLVRSAVNIPVAADESVGNLAQARHVVAAGAADVLIIKPMLAGGLRPALDMIEVACAAGLDAVVTSTIDTGVGVAASLHVAATLSAPRRACGLATGALLTTDLLTHSLTVEQGTMPIPVGPGLAVHLSEDELRQSGEAWHMVS